MTRASFIVIDGKPYRWKDILDLRRAQRAAAAAAHGWRGSPGRLAGRPLRDRLRRPFRQCHDWVEGGHAVAQR